jgi:tRNA nucleotidyltransferase (CCA-adding enzyme)
MKTPYWEHYSHPADVGIRGVGTDRAQAFEMAALAMTAAIAEPETIEPRGKVDVECSDDDDEMLLVAWLNCLIYEMATRHMLFGKFEVRIEDHKLWAIVWGEPLNAKKHGTHAEVKAATVTDLKVAERGDGTWVAQCIVDV